MDSKMQNAEIHQPLPLHDVHRRVEYVAPPQQKKMSKAWIWIPILLVLLGAGGYFVYTRIHSFAEAGSGAGGKFRDMKGRVTPVIAATARSGDLKIYLNGLGTVTPLNTVTVRSRVDGQLMKVHFVEGQTVKEGEPLFEIDPRPFEVQKEQAEGQMAKDQAQLKNAKADLQRYQIAKEAVSQQQLDTAAANVSQFEGAVKIDQAAIDSAKLNITYCEIDAPLTGRIGLKVVDKGNIIHASDPNGLAVITQLKPIAVLFSLSEDRIPEVIKQMNAGKKLAVDAFDRSFTNKLGTGTLLAIDSQIDPTSASVRFKAVFPNEDGVLFPNQFVNARLLVDVIKDTILIPSAAVQRSPSETFVYVIKPDSTVEMRGIETGPSEGDQTSIVSGLEAGEKVVTDGVDKLQPGSKVSTGGGRPGGATRPGGKGAATQGAAGGGGEWKGQHGGANGGGGDEWKGQHGGANGGGGDEWKGQHGGANGGGGGNGGGHGTSRPAKPGAEQ
jgi:multidrug efflux system membrane fusion protein